MNSADFFYYISAVAFTVMAGFVSWAAYHLVETLKELKTVLEDVKDTTHDLTMLKTGLKAGALNLIGNLLSRPKKKGGDRNGS
ncbi:MAG: hypothetical protein UX87_C0010G0024 [Candidatus Amesbacteria bacterium GW2011_GWA1_47_16]|uniref:Uncharacterized protein n=4 Tax=Candidatus Amesiibacteriota TaxID=1752730 RepID=A0A0G1V2H1_9BACT|nr:MAG: hypothetical protein UX86_C0012G0015 [Candidatus Amesbacteria bacterium GW2011_GWC1_47_15]KKU64259.1 MAG: hypothetical protein UX87_C0010G0024 [Candidatus Amesbacteria bacterium GW2011_GWA1_47_16]KKU98135.1 MAG: hypothetical protein UY28_C0007G0024 [Candidatus Amesbacteria bacterium GW2011_GWB1_48_13]OGC97979.1 MAG: hypothetical protein A2701_02930 [Candidatus Amesbacteria bacterium RIFCSPHIGHO2_01_FULL_47_34]OGC99956.1 MAG: hypothetical protein A2972_03785 [Candidatus Amesbacteria bact